MQWLRAILTELSGVARGLDTLPVMVFAREDDARRVLEIVPRRFEKYGLTVHPVKNRLADFHRSRRGSPSHRIESGKPEPFDLLGSQTVLFTRP
jgi:hypothetical protein